ncbi:hypothetical protein BOQ64_13215 [Chryseobacterium sp. CH25]|nr:hypothetical protein BOQ64_13215 [Chryseobacterium sp. CH25]RXM64661.1 hypothetical protein BOQ60_10600 [Chryseobacterium sp. CH1]
MKAFGGHRKSFLLIKYTKYYVLAKANIHYVILSGLKPAPIDPVDRLLYRTYLGKILFTIYLITSIDMGFSPCYKFKNPYGFSQNLQLIYYLYNNYSYQKQKSASEILRRFRLIKGI